MRLSRKPTGSDRGAPPSARFRIASGAIAGGLVIGFLVVTFYMNYDSRHPSLLLIPCAFIFGIVAAFAKITSIILRIDKMEKRSENGLCPFCG
jgi:hypothetical protein